MLTEVHASLAASDIDRARQWYEEKLGLTPFESWPGLLRFRVGASGFSVYQTSSAGTAKNTVAIWKVEDLRADVLSMRARGVIFEDYDFGEAKTIDGVLEDGDDGTLNAWFTDSEGNIMSLVQEPMTAAV